jgi:hypothetical protein
MTFSPRIVPVKSCLSESGPPRPYPVLDFRFLFAYDSVSFRGPMVRHHELTNRVNARAVTVLYGCPEMPRLSHYFLPRILLNQGRVLYLDGANQISPLLIARFARERGLDPSAFNTLIRVSRAFTCFQLTELIRRVPKILEAFAADVLIVTALPDLFFDEDVRDREARASFEHALEALQQIAMLPISIAVFSDATSFKTKRRDFFQQLCKQASQVLRVEARSDSELSFSCEKTAPLLSQ